MHVNAKYFGFQSCYIFFHYTSIVIGGNLSVFLEHYEVILFGHSVNKCLMRFLLFMF